MAKQQPTHIDPMTVVVLLIMTLFGGIVGYYIGRASLAPTMLSAREAGTMMQTMGKMMNERGERYRDREMMEQGTMMEGQGRQMMQGMGSMMGY